MRAGRLDYLLFDVADETLKRVFKEIGAEVNYNFLESKCQLKGQEIADNPEVFSTGLESLLLSGASMIEKMILENLYSKLQLKFSEKKITGFQIT